MQLQQKTINVFLKSRGGKNPYHVGESADLVYGLYCESVIGKQQELLVPDATQSEVWRHNNPDVSINMISYLGVPLNWPDGDVFGTVCVLDNKENHYSNIQRELLSKIKESLEKDLELLVGYQQLKRANEELVLNNQVKSRFLTMMSHDLRGPLGSLNEFLTLILRNTKKQTDNEGYEALEMAHVTTRAAYGVLENLLTWSKNDLLHVDPVKVPTNLVMIIDRILTLYTEPIRLKK
jgi:GAF domain-containing protein